MRVLLALVLLVVSSAATAQTPAPPGPYVFDVHGVLSGLPSQSIGLQVLAPATLVPTRGNGFEVGAHVYAGRLGVARIGVGVAGLSTGGAVLVDPRRRGDLRTRVRSVVPQISFNFGTRDGWSYLSGGVGASTVRVDSTPSGARETPGIRTINIGGGARWFFNRHVAVGFDLRVHRLSRKSSLAGASIFAAGAGVALR